MDKTELVRPSVLEAPRVPSESAGREAHWQDRVRIALEARKLGAQLREGRPKSFHPVVGRI